VSKHRPRSTKTPLDLIAFDGDDTLWHNERSFRQARDRFLALLRGAGVTLDADAIDDRINQTEVANIEYFGYGVSSFVLSLMEAAIELTGGRIAGAALHEVLAVAKAMMTEPIELFPAARETVKRLGRSWPLMLITKGDLLHQTSKIDRSGLRASFRHVEVVSHKTPDVYAAILARHGVSPDRFLMIGNSLRSDILPVVEAGGWAVHVPAALSWSHEHADVPPRARGRYFEIAALDRLPDVIGALARRSLSRRAAAAAGRRRPAAGSRRS
jgi:putative hydrolase of the HAD superfamily